MNFNPFSGPNLVGFDIQPDYLRFVELGKNRSSYRLSRFGKHLLPAGIFSEGKIKRWENLQAHLEDFIEIYGLKNRSTAIHLPINLVHMQKIQLQKGLLVDEIESEISAHIERHLPGLTDALFIDFQAMPIKNSDQNNVFFAAVRKEFLFQYTECLKQAGLKVKVVDVDVCALKRAVSLALELLQMPLATNTIVHIVNDLVTLIIFSKDEILFYQHWDVNEPTPFWLQLKTRIDLFQASYREISVKNIAFCGSAYQKKLDLHHLTQYQFYYPDLYSTMKLPANFVESEGDEFLIAIGLALREAPKW